MRKLCKTDVYSAFQIKLWIWLKYFGFDNDSVESPYDIFQFLKYRNMKDVKLIMIYWIVIHPSYKMIQDSAIFRNVYKICIKWDSPLTLEENNEVAIKAVKS